MESKELLSQEYTIYQRLGLIFNEARAVAKDKEVRFGKTNYTYRASEDILNHLKPLFGKYGVFVIPSVESFEDKTSSKGAHIVRLNMNYSFVGILGDKVEVKTVGFGVDHGDKATEKAKTSALKYTLIQMFLLPTEEEYPQELKELWESTEEEEALKALNDVTNRDELIAVYNKYIELFQNPESEFSKTFDKIKVNYPHK